jgi:putative mRNA 3-end processing factor
MDLITLTSKGLYCKRGDFYIDPWEPMERAIVTHAHGDHAHPGHSYYLCAEPGVEITRQRVGLGANVEGVPYRKVFEMGDTRVSLHPAGHIRGSAQVRVECDGEVWVFTGDCKRDPDPTCEPFEVVKCDAFITEATFALPIYRWRPAPLVARDIHEWWMRNRERGMNSVLCVYALGKAQRILAELARYTNETVYLHGALRRLTDLYRNAGVEMVPTAPAVSENGERLRGELILAPPSASGSTWMRRFEPYEVGFASGWMAVRGNRRREAYDRGFVVSDHSDWPSLIRTIEETGARRVFATHGFSEELARYVTEEMGLDGKVLRTQFNSDEESAQGAGLGGYDSDDDIAPPPLTPAAAAPRKSLLREKPPKKKRASRVKKSATALGGAVSGDGEPDLPVLAPDERPGRPDDQLIWNPGGDA